MTDNDGIRDAIVAMHGLYNVDEPYTLHYDETENSRLLRLTENGLNIGVPGNFVLGGVAHRRAAPALDPEALHTTLRLQKSAPELKLKQLGKGNFLKLLKSRKITTFLDWLEGQELFIHYQVVDQFYWATVDITDSILDAAQLNVSPGLVMELKDTLNTILRADIGKTAGFLRQYSYPDVPREQLRSFINGLREMLDANSDILNPVAHQMLRQILLQAGDIQKMVFLEGEKRDILIDSFATFYRDRIDLFRNATHVLDDEPKIVEHLKGTSSKFAFVNSKENAWVQVSDAVTGLLSKFFTVSDAELTEALDYDQGRNLDTMKELMQRSITECPAFALYLLPATDQRRIARVLG